MKKLTVWMLVLAMLCGVCCAGAEGALPFATIGEAIEAAGDSAQVYGTDEIYNVALEKDGKYIRVIAELDQKAREMSEAVSEAEDVVEALANLENYYWSLPVTKAEEFTVQPKDKAELDALAGKTLRELAETGYEYGSSDAQGESGNVVFTLYNGVYQYDFTVDTDYEGYMAHQEQGSYDDLKVTSAAFSGLSANAADPHYHTDGTVEEEEDLFFGEGGELLTAIEEAVAKAEKGEGSLDEMIKVLKEQYPEEAEFIDTLMQMYAPSEGV